MKHTLSFQDLSQGWVGWRSMRIWLFFGHLAKGLVYFSFFLLACTLVFIDLPLHIADGKSFKTGCFAPLTQWISWFLKLNLEFTLFSLEKKNGPLRILQGDGEYDVDVTLKARWVNFRNASGVSYDCKIPIKLKWKFYQIAIRSMMLCCSVV